LPVGAMKPDTKLASKLQRRERITVSACGLMSRFVARLAQRMEKIGRLFRDDSIIGEPAESVVKGLAVAVVEGVMGGNPVAQKLGELAQLENRRRWVLAKISFGEGSEAHQLCVMRP